MFLDLEQRGLYEVQDDRWFKKKLILFFTFIETTSYWLIFLGLFTMWRHFGAPVWPASTEWSTFLSSTFFDKIIFFFFWQDHLYSNQPLDGRLCNTALVCGNFLIWMYSDIYLCQFLMNVRHVPIRFPYRSSSFYEQFVARNTCRYGADVNSMSDTGSTPVRSACFMTHLDIVKLLVII